MKLNSIIDWFAHSPRIKPGSAISMEPVCMNIPTRSRENSPIGIVVLNYGRPEVRDFLTANALFSFDK